MQYTKWQEIEQISFKRVILKYLPKLATKFFKLINKVTQTLKNR